MTKEAPYRIGQALLLWAAVGGPILLWWPAALRLPRALGRHRAGRAGERASSHPIACGAWRGRLRTAAPSARSC